MRAECITHTENVNCT